MIIVGLGGLKGVGKNTVAEYLVKEYGFRTASLADPIKRLLNARFHWEMSDWDNRRWKEEPQYRFGNIERSDGPYVYDEVFSPRSWAQWLGTEVGRAIGGQDVWVDLLMDEIDKLPPESRVVITDARFENEVHSVRSEGGFSMCLVDPDTRKGPAEHSSEDINPDWFDYVVPAQRGNLIETFTNVDIVMHLEMIEKVK